MGQHTRPTRTALVVITTAAVLATACGAQPEVHVDSHGEALTAIADSFSQSWTWQGRVEVDLDDADRHDIDEFHRTMLRDWEEASESHVEGALGEDGSWRTALVDDGTTFLDVRLGVGELLAAQTLEPDASIYLRLDLPYLVRHWGYWAPSPEELRREAVASLSDSPFQAVVLALIDGDWGGLTGPLDLASMGVTDADLEEARRDFQEEFIGVADRDTMLALLDEATTLHDFTRVEGGGSQAILDVHPRDAAFAVYDLFDDAQHLAAGHTRPEDLPHTLEAVATVTFDGDGMVTEVATDVLAVARELNAHDPDGAGGAADLAGFSTDSTLRVVFSFGDHGQVATVLDVPDPVTASWGELAEAFAGLWHQPTRWEHSEEVAVEAEIEVPDELVEAPDTAEVPGDDGEVPGDDGEVEGDVPGTAPNQRDGSEAVGQVERELERAAMALHGHHAQHGVFDPAVVDQTGGAPHAPGVTITVWWADETSFCLHGDHADLDVKPLMVRPHDAPGRVVLGELTCDDR